MMTFKIEKDWITEAGLRAVVIMLVDRGYRCGYVGIDSCHPLYGASADKPNKHLKFNPNRTICKMSPIQVICAAVHDESELNTPAYVFEVHGGLTYSRNGEGLYPVEANLWWFGFDCGHAGDSIDPNHKYWKDVKAFNSYVFRSLEYCIDECESLASQLQELEATTEVETTTTLSAQSSQILGKHDEILDRLTKLEQSLAEEIKRSEDMMKRLWPEEIETKEVQK